MSDNDLKSMLQSADVSFGREATPIDSVVVQGRIARRRLVRRTAIGASGATVAVLFAVAVIQSRTTPRKIAQPTQERQEAVDVDLLQQQLADLRARTEHQEAQLTAVRSAARLFELQREFNELERRFSKTLPPSVRLKAELQSLAAQRFVLAETMASQYDQPKLAAEQYRRVIDQFPNTRWSADARTALARLRM